MTISLIGQNKQYSIMLKKHVNGQTPQPRTLLNAFDKFNRQIIKIPTGLMVRVTAPDEDHYDCTVLEIKFDGKNLSAGGPGFYKAL